MKAPLPIRLGFIGAGQMARALARGFVRAGLVCGSQIIGHDPVSAATAEFLKDVPDVTLAPTNGRVLADSDVVFLAVKPQQVAAVARELNCAAAKSQADRPDGSVADTAQRSACPASPASGTLLVSIAAGVSLNRLSELFGSDRIIRVMPNTPCLVGMSASGYCAASGATESDRRLVQQLLESVGIAFELEEKLLDVVTGLSGSGPAFVYVMIEALSDAGVRMGLPRQVALKLAAQTVRGAAEMVLASGQHPALLKDQVTSPGGTTIAGLAALESAGVRSGLMAAVEAATRRSIELGKM